MSNSLVKIALAFLLSLLPIFIWSQTTLQGKVLDATTEEALLGVNIVVRGTAIGTATNAAGEFTLQLPDANPVVLALSFVGYRPYTIQVNPVQQAELLVITLDEDVLGLEEIVVTGQGIDVTKRRLSTNVTVVDAEALEKNPATRVDELIRSQVPTLQINNAGGQPGSSTIIRSRGVSSALVGSTPIIYVDGVRVDNLNNYSELSLNLSGNRGQGAASSALADIPVENIERIEFINGGAATTLYGSDAANGVIQIITKKGTVGKANIVLETQMGIEKGTADFYYFDRTKDLFYQDAFYQLYRIGVNGGNDQFGYSFSGNMSNTPGTWVADNNKNRKYDLRTGLNARLNKNLRYNASFGFSNNTYSRFRNGNAGGYTALWFAEAARSFAFRRPNGQFYSNNIDTISNEAFNDMKAFVALAEDLQDSRFLVNRFQTSQGLEFSPLPNLKIRGTAGIDYRASREQGITTNEYLIYTQVAAAGTDNLGQIQKFDRNFLGLTLELVGQYDLRFGDFSFLTTAGTQFFRNTDRQTSIVGTNVRDGAEVIRGAGTVTADEVQYIVANYGVYAQENIGFKNRYFLEFGIRGDGNSAFGENIGTQYYPKVGVSYILSDEPFFQGIAKNVLSTFKLRGSYGVAGNFPTPFAQDRTVQFNSFLSQQAATFGQPGNKDLKPEKVYTLEVGANLGFLNDRLSVNVTYYNAETRDALFAVPLAPSIGEVSQLRNVGTIENRGIELSARLNVIRTKNWDVNIGGAYNTLHNEVTDAGGAAAFPISGFSERTIQSVVQEGQSVGFLRGYKATFDANGNFVSTQALSNLGTTIPDQFGSLNLDITFANRLNLVASADYQMGAFAHSFDRQFRFNYGLPDEDVPAAFYEANKARLSQVWLDITDLFVEPTDFLKVRLIGLNYTVPESWYQGWARSIRIGFNVTNPLNFYKSSFDPEATISGGSGSRNQNGPTTGGFNYSVPSAPRQFLGSLKVSF